MASNGMSSSLSDSLKLEAATGASYRRQKSDVMARRALHDGGYASTSGDD